MLLAIWYSMKEPNIEVDCHYIMNLVQNETISMTHVPSEKQVTYIFMKSFFIGDFSKCCNKLNMIDIYHLCTNLRGSVEIFDM